MQRKGGSIFEPPFRCPLQDDLDSYQYEVLFLTKVCLAHEIILLERSGGIGEDD